MEQRSGWSGCTAKKVSAGPACLSSGCPGNQNLPARHLPHKGVSSVSTPCELTSPLGNTVSEGQQACLWAGENIGTESFSEFPKVTQQTDGGAGITPGFSVYPRHTEALACARPLTLGSGCLEMTPVPTPWKDACCPISRHIPELQTTW